MTKEKAITETGTGTGTGWDLDSSYDRLPKIFLPN
jgi:hypothetical protein